MKEYRKDFSKKEKAMAVGVAMMLVVTGSLLWLWVLSRFMNLLGGAD